MRRTTAYEPCAIHSGSFAPPPPGTKTRCSKSASSGRGFLVPSIWPIRLRVVMGRAVAPAERLKPFICQRTRAVPAASFWRARRALKATSASSAPICTHRSPLLRRGSKASEENAGSGSSAAGRRSSSPVRLKKLCPKPKVTVREDGPASRAIAVSSATARPAVRRSAVRDQRRSRAAAPFRPTSGSRSKAARWPRTAVRW